MSFTPAIEKSRARLQAKARRAACHDPALGHQLIGHFPAPRFRGQMIAGYWPHGDEIDILPLLRALHAHGESICLPVTGRKGQALTFRAWTPQSEMTRGAYGIPVPKNVAEIRPGVLLVPLLAFTDTGERLGYGGGYYDRTIAELRAGREVYACGVAYAGQKAVNLPTEPTDQKLDAILTEEGFTEFAAR